MQADVVDLDRLRTGTARAGFYFAIWGMGTKLALGAAAGGAFYALTSPVSIRTGRTARTRSSRWRPPMRWRRSRSRPVAVALVWNYPLTPKRHAIIRRRLEAREISARSSA